MRVVFDTNIFISALVISGSLAESVFSRATLITEFSNEQYMVKLMFWLPGTKRCSGDTCTIEIDCGYFEGLWLKSEISDGWGKQEHRRRRISNDPNPVRYD